MNEPDYTDAGWLRQEIRNVLEFYYPTCVDQNHGGFVAQLDETTGEVYDPDTKHLVGTSRFTANFAVGALLDGPDWCRPMAKRGVEFLRYGHFDADRQGYDWLLDGREPVDRTRICYGHAFVLLAYARGTEAEVEGAEVYLREAYDLLMERFWEPSHRLCRSQFSPGWDDADDYRGQNANMHACESLLAAYEATGRDRYLERATDIAERITVDLARETDGRLWEHYTSEWNHDMAYNRDDPEHKFRPWGYQPGHHAEWAKLLAILDRYIDQEWPRTRSRDLFDVALSDGWDEQHGGFYYTVDLDGDPIVTDKYRWPVAEAIGAAAALYERTGELGYRTWYGRLWTYAKRHIVTDNSNWRLKLARDNSPYAPPRGSEVEPGYHPIGACYEAIRSFQRRPVPDQR
jgi:mannose/cellobiose epimerase-like protein (N-acyl-D-glucosamine 2-epimerase family)